MSKKNGILRKILMLALALILAIAGWMLSQYGFKSIQNLRQIERIPQTSIASALQGEVKLNAQVTKISQLIPSEHFGIPCVYYFYRLEREETDSDGDTHWSTQHESRGSVDFFLQDSTGQLKVNIQTLVDDNLDYSMPISQQREVGGYRYTEWRIEPGDQLFVLGMLQGAGDSAEVGFVEPGQYLPLISKYGESEEKSDLGLIVILAVCGGISLIAFAAFCLTSGLGIHRILIFLFVLSFSTIIPLVQLGLSMLHTDIVTGQERLNGLSETSLNKINQSIHDFAHPQANWPDLSDRLRQMEERLAGKQRQKIDDIQINLAFAQQQYINQLKVFPNNLIAWFYSVEPDNISKLLNQQQSSELDLRLKKFRPARALGILPFILVGLGLLLCVGLSYLGFRLIRLKRHIENLPTSKTSGLVFGLSELKGRVSKIDEQEPLISPLSSSRCYWFRYIVEEKRGSGDDAKWVTIEDREKYQAFYCKDAYGKIKVSPQHAEIISHRKKTRRRGRMRYTEKTLNLSDKVYILGNAKIDRVAGDKLEIRGAIKERPYLITNLSEQAIMLRKANGGMLSLTVAFSSLMFAGLFYLGSLGSFSPADYLLSALIAPVYMALIILILHYNDLIFLKQRASRNLSNIDVAMQKRYDLIPNLQKIVKRYLTHESKLLDALTEVRTQGHASANQLTKMSAQLETEQQILNQILIRSEDYPDFKAQKLNVKLMNKLVDLENEVALMREGYNDAVNYYNIRIASIPDVFFARILNFKSMLLFTYKERKFSRINIDFE